MTLEHRKAHRTVAYRFLHHHEWAITGRKRTVFYAQIPKRLEALLLFFSKAESKVFAVVTSEELASQFAITGVIRLRRGYGGQAGPGYSFLDQIVKAGEIFDA